MSEAGLMIPEERWFTNLRTKGNTGAASIFIMLEEAFNGGRFAPGDRILLMVPESGRFSVSFVHLTCVRGADTADEPLPTKAASPIRAERGLDWLLEELALVWAGFETQLSRVPIVKRIETGTASLEDYRSLALQPAPAGLGGGTLDHQGGVQPHGGVHRPPAPSS